jgi:hypothetical protein
MAFSGLIFAKILRHTAFPQSKRPAPITKNKNAPRKGRAFSHVIGVRLSA